MSLSESYYQLDEREQTVWDGIIEQGISSWADRFERLADLYTDKMVIECVHTKTRWSYRDLDRFADNIAGWAIRLRESRIGICLNNSPEFLASVLGLAKAGITAVLFNTREPSQRLDELAKKNQVKTVLTLNQPDEITAILPKIQGVFNYDVARLLAIPWQGRVTKVHRQQISLDDTAVVIFTSGTSGLSKGALFSHRRLIGAGIAWSLRNTFDQNTRCYIPLPLYHGNGLAVAFASCIEAGGTAVIRERFSVSAFLSDIRQYQCNSAVYIGELWRYLLNSKPQTNDADNPLKTVFGNGLSMDMWEAVTQRFAIDHVVEHFGATEMPASALTNWFDVPGYCGFIPPEHAHAKNIVLVNSDNLVVPDGEAGEALLRVPGGEYKGYLDESQNAAKVIKGLFGEDDLWWRSGDLLKRNTKGFFTFIDRLDGSFRWKGENVSTLDVEQAIYASGLVKEAVVYGVKIIGLPGKAGMASIVPKDVMSEDSVNRLLDFLQKRLAPYAIPLLVRVMPDNHPTTTTLKILKTRLAAESMKLLDKYPHFMLINGTYHLKDASTLNKILTVEESSRG
jgi:fatty-acyl-CoA synthase